MQASGAVERPDGRQSRWTAHNLERRAAIIDAAVALMEEQGPGAEIHVQQIAERAGLVRTVIYRHFSDRADLDHAVQSRVLDMLRAEIEPVLALRGSIDEIIPRIIKTYVAWAASHPALHRLADQVLPGAGTDDVQIVLKEISEQVSGLIQMVVLLLDAKLAKAQEEALDVLAFGIVAQAFATVRAWITRTPLAPEVDELADLMAKSVWYQLDGHARAMGIVLDPTLPLDDPAALGL